MFWEKWFLFMNQNHSVFYFFHGHSKTRSPLFPGHLALMEWDNHLLNMLWNSCHFLPTGSCLLNSNASTRNCTRNVSLLLFHILFCGSTCSFTWLLFRLLILFDMWFTLALNINYAPDNRGLRRHLFRIFKSFSPPTYILRARVGRWQIILHSFFAPFTLCIDRCYNFNWGHRYSYWRNKFRRNDCTRHIG